MKRVAITLFTLSLLTAAHAATPKEYLNTITGHFNTVPITTTPTTCDPVIVALTPGGRVACVEALSDTATTKDAIDLALAQEHGAFPLTFWERVDSDWTSKWYETTSGDLVRVFLHRPSTLFRVMLIVTVVDGE